MNGLAFFDANILVCADDASNSAKQALAIRLFEGHQQSSAAVVSLQVMQEYFPAATRKPGVSADVAQSKVELLARGNVLRFAERDVIAAIELTAFRCGTQ